MSEIPHIHPGNQELARAIPRAGTPRLTEPASPAPCQRIAPPLEFLSDLFSEKRDSLSLPPELVQNLSPHALTTISAGEGSILSILCAAVSGIVTINKQLDTVNTRLVELSKENEQLRERIHDVSSVLANDVATSEELPLNSALRDLSHRVSAPPPSRQPPQAPLAQSASAAPARPSPPAPKENPSPRLHNQPAPPGNIDPSVHCPYYDTRLGKMFGDPKLYAKAFPHCWEAEQFRNGKYDLSKITPATQHPDYKPKHLPTYAQASGSGRPPRRKQRKIATATEVAHPGGKSSKPGSSLPFASRRFFAIRETPLPHPRAARLTKTFPNIVATTLTQSNCLLPKGFRVKVNNRGAVSLTGTDPLTPAESYAPYFNAITRRLNQSYPTGSSPWQSFSLAPTAVELAIHSVPIDVLPDDDDQLFPFLKSSILNAKAVKISAARYLNKDRASRISKQATAVVVSVDPDDIQKLLPSFFLFSERLKVEKTVNANRYTQYNNCYRFGHTSQRCKQTHPSCPFCALHHTRSAHRCLNPTCPKGGNSRPISDCCPTSPPHYPNCGCDHDAFSRECRARPAPPPRQEAPPSNADESGSDGEEDLEMEDDGGHAPSTPKAITAQAVDLRTPHPSRHAPASTGEASQPMGGPAPPDSMTSQRVRPGNE